MTSTGGGAPIWVTVIVSRFIGGFAAGIVGSLTYVQVQHTASFQGSSAASDTSSWIFYLPALIGAIATGYIIYLLLPRMSGRSISPFQAIVAAASGSFFTVIMSILMVHGARTSTSSSSMLLLGGGSVLVAAFSWVISLTITTWMVSGASLEVGAIRHSPTPSPHTWSDRDDTLQAERGYWGGLDDTPPDAGPEPPEGGPEPPPEDPWR